MREEIRIQKQRTSRKKVLEAYRESERENATTQSDHDTNGDAMDEDHHQPHSDHEKQPLGGFEWADEEPPSPPYDEDFRSMPMRSIPMRIIPQAEARSGGNTPETGRGSPDGNGPAGASSESAARFLTMAPSDLADAFSRMASASLGSSSDSLSGTKRQRENGLGSGIPAEVYYYHPDTTANGLGLAEREIWLGGPTAAHAHSEPTFRAIATDTSADREAWFKQSADRGHPFLDPTRGQGQAQAFTPVVWGPTGPTDGSLIAPTAVKMEEQDDHGDLTIRRHMLGQGPVQGQV